MREVREQRESGRKEGEREVSQGERGEMKRDFRGTERKRETLLRRGK